MFGKFLQKGVTLNNQWPIDQLPPGDVLVIDMYGRVDGGGVVPDGLKPLVSNTTA